MPKLSHRLERLIRASNDLAPDLPLGPVLQWVADTARGLIGARYAAIGMLAPQGGSLELFVTSGIDPETRARIGSIPVGRGVLGLVIREARPIRLDDIATHPAAAGFPPHHPAMRSFLGVPVSGRHGVLGNLYLTEKTGARSFSAEDEYLALLLAEKAAAAVETARAFGEIIRLADDVQRLLRTRERFFAMVNHELRNSLAAVLGWAEMLTRKKDPASVPRAAYEVLEAAESAVSLINDLLDLSRLDEDRLKPVIAPVDPMAVLHRAAAKVTPAAQARSVTIEVAGPSDRVTCQTDAHRVEQILVNLLTNAVRHSPEGASVWMGLELEGPDCRIVVADQGPGIPEEELERVFDVYATSQRDGPGMGLGLPLSRRLARVLGGDLTAANRPAHPGEASQASPGAGGAVLTLRLPVSPPAPSRAT